MTLTRQAASPPGGWGSALANSLGIAAWRIPVVILCAVGVYLAFLVLVRLFGTRILTAWSTFDAVVIIMFGAVAGRVIIGHPPTLAAGVIGLTTLMVMEVIFGQVRKMRAVHTTVTSPPVVIMAHGRVLADAMARQHVHRTDLASALRRAGVTDPAQVQCVIVEPTGALSVLREGTPVAPELLHGVIGAHLVTRPDGPADHGSRGSRR
ncbi:MAG: DUF421 domain-containing protein [Corynebacterium nuruki]|nr:DUF421 domain-containing protein [Corynebacterium nuruki]